MRYLLLIYGDEKVHASVPPAEMETVFAEYGRFTAELGASGRMLGGEPLTPTSTATSVRVRSGKTLVTDGPFAETKEQLGGFYMIEASDLDEAVKWAAKIPGARFGTIEVRPIWEIHKKGVTEAGRS
ncbi:YciI family protein [bacterium]|nr:YciI family protein [bacterium]